MLEGRVDDAVARFKDAVKADPSSAEAQNSLGVALRAKYYETGDETYRQEEISHFRKAVKLTPRWVIPIINLATALWDTGQMAEAARLFSQALILVPSHPDGEAIKRRLDMAQQAEVVTQAPEKKKTHKANISTFKENPRQATSPSQRGSARR